MSEQDLLAKETFYKLLSKSGAERIEEEDKLFLEAKNKGIEKRFKASLKKYEKEFAQKIKLDDTINLPKSKYPIEDYNMGDYSITKDGITTGTNYKFSYIPVLPVERYINQDTGKEKVKIIYYKENEWKELIIDRSQIAISQKLLLLSDYGLDITSENVKYYINFLNEIMNINDIKKLDSVSHLGWSNDEFIPYDSKGIFDGADEFRNIYKAICTHGNYNKWKETIEKMREHKIVKLAMAVTLASPLLEKLNIQPYMANLWSSMSGNGKTLTCMIAMSIWGNPNVGALRLSSNNTQNYYTIVASFMRNITCYFDELQIIKKSKLIDTESLVMDLCNGTEKGRLNKNSQAREVKTWFNNFLFTSNDALVKENAGEQVYNRVVDLEINEKIIDGNGQDIAKTITENYGFAGKEYMAYIKSLGWEEIFKRYKKLYASVLKMTPATDKQANVFASILLANEIANECIFNDDYILTVEDIAEYVNNKDDIKTSIKAKEYIKDIINLNSKKFEEYGYGEHWGKIKEVKTGQFVCYMNIQALYRELERGGFEFNTVKKEWGDMNFLIKNSAGRYIHQTTIENEKGNYIVLNLQI